MKGSRLATMVALILLVGAWPFLATYIINALALTDFGLSRARMAFAKIDAGILEVMALLLLGERTRKK